jgi:hypothetical protein
MVRFRKYYDKAVDVEKVKDAGKLGTFGVECTYLPDPPEDFDEFEFRTILGDLTVVIMVTVELGKIKRLLFSAADPEDHDSTRSLTEVQLAGLLEEKGDQLVEFFEYITLSQ